MSRPTIDSQADIVISLHLGSFVNGLLKGNNKGIPKSAPWPLSCNDSDLARVILTKLEELAVRKELSVVQSATKEENSLSDSIWATMKGQIEDGFLSQSCTECRADGKSPSITMQRCGGCGNAWYCSRECQRTDWKHHKSFCKKSQE